MLSSISIHCVEVPLPTVKTIFLLVLILVRENMEDHLQQNRWKMLLVSHPVTMGPEENNIAL